MDDRQSQIRERAGLEESRLNEDFIEFLRKYGSWLMLLVALGGGVMFAHRKWTEYQARRLDSAFMELEQVRAGGNASPEALAGVAADHAGVKSVSLLAKLEAGDAYLRSLRRGVKAGAEVDDKGAVKNPDDMLSDADRANYLTKAAELYQSVADSTSGDSARLTLRISAMYGLAAIAECRREFDKAKSFYEDVQKLVENTAYSPQAQIAKARIAALPELAALPKLAAASDLPDLAPEEKPPELPTPAPSGLNLEPVQLTPGGGNAPAATPVQTPPPQPPAAPQAPATKPAETDPKTPAPASPK